MKYRKNTYKKISEPDIYFHKEAIKLYKKCKNKKEYEKLLTNKYYIEEIYATLIAWGMERRKGKLMAFKDFRNSIDKDKLATLFNCKLYNLDKERRKILGQVFLKLRTMESTSQFVGNSKVLHHLLPGLVVPMDGAHTLKFFCKYSPYDKNPKKQKRKEKDLFLCLLDEFRELCKRIPERLLKKSKPYDTSVLKIIDNAIIGNDKW